MRQKRAKDKEKMRAHTKRTAGKQATSAKVCTKAAIKHAGRETTPRNAGKEKPQKADMTAGSLTHSRRAAAPPCTPARRAKQAKQRQQKPRTHKRTEGERQAAAAQARPSQTQKQQAAHKPGPRQRHAGRKNAGAPGTKVLTTAAGRARTTSPADGAAHRMQKNPSEQAKLAFALLPARRGLVNRGRQKIASLFLAGTVFFCFAMRAAQNKRGRRPLLSPAAF